MKPDEVMYVRVVPLQYPPSAKLFLFLLPVWNKQLSYHWKRNHYVESWLCGPMSHMSAHKPGKLIPKINPASSNVGYIRSREQAPKGGWVGKLKIYKIPIRQQQYCRQRLPLRLAWLVTQNPCRHDGDYPHNTSTSCTSSWCYRLRCNPILNQPRSRPQPWSMVGSSSSSFYSSASICCGIVFPRVGSLISQPCW